MSTRARKDSYLVDEKSGQYLLLLNDTGHMCLFGGVELREIHGWRARKMRGKEVEVVDDVVGDGRAPRGRQTIDGRIVKKCQNFESNGCHSPPSSRLAEFPSHHHQRPSITQLSHFSNYKKAFVVSCGHPSLPQSSPLTPLSYPAPVLAHSCGTAYYSFNSEEPFTMS